MTKPESEGGYGPDKGEQVFYASKNKGTISGVDAVLGLHGGTGGGLVEVHGPAGGHLSGVDAICDTMKDEK